MVGCLYVHLLGIDDTQKLPGAAVGPRQGGLLGGNHIPIAPVDSGSVVPYVAISSVRDGVVVAVAVLSYIM